MKKHADEPTAYVALAQVYSDANRGAAGGEGAAGRAGEVPGRHDDRLRARRRVRQAEEVRGGRGGVPAGARARSRERRRRSTTSATCSPSAASGSTSRSSYLKKALQIEPDNGSYLDSLGWAYFKADKLDLAEDNLQRAADQLQDQLGHPGSLRRRAVQARRATTRRSPRGRARSPATATRSIAADIDKKIRAAKQKLRKK